METMDGKSLDITEERLNKLKEILPDAFTEGRIDWEKLQATLGEDIEFKNERYVLNWAGKSDAFRVLQSPTTATLVPCKIDESIIEAVISEKPEKVVTLECLFKNNDQLKTNTALQMKDVGIEFKAV